MKTIVYSTHKFDKPYLEMAFNNTHNLVFLKDSLNEKTIDYAKGSEAISLFTGDNANSNILESLSNIGISQSLHFSTPAGCFTKRSSFFFL